MKIRVKSLDGLRGLAALGVMLFHLFYIFNLEFGFSLEPWILFENGHYGVELFFIISGFVIFYSLTESQSAKVFLINRFWRLYPTYLLCMILTFSCVYYFPISENRSYNLIDFFTGMTMQQGLIGVKDIDPSYWSLLIEFWFYVFIAIIAFFRGLKHIYLVLYIWLFVAFVNNVLIEIPHLGFFFNYKYAPFFISGIALFKSKQELIKAKSYYVLFFLSFIVSVFSGDVTCNRLLGLVVVYSLFILGIYLFPRIFENKLLLFFGNISYPFYLIHQNIGFSMLLYMRNEFDVKITVYSVLFVILILVVIAYLINAIFERSVVPRIREKVHLDKI